MQTFNIKSKTNPAHSYPVLLLDTNTWYCPCKGFGYRGTCSHIKEAQQGLDIVVAAQVQAPHPALQNYCSTCQVPLTGTHAFLTQCSKCISRSTFTRAGYPQPNRLLGQPPSSQLPSGSHAHP